MHYCKLPGLTAEQVAKTTHDYTDAKDNDCNTCGYVRPLYTVTTDNATAKLEDKVLDAPVAAGTEVTLTAADASEGKTFAGWKLYKVVMILRVKSRTKQNLPSCWRMASPLPRP